MGFELGVVVVGPLAPERILPVTRLLLDRWPWLRLPITTAHARHVLLGSVERTSYMVGSGVHARLLDEVIQHDLVEVSQALPDASIAWIHTDCFGGNCDSDGRVARAGAQVCASNSLPELLGQVGIETSGYFAAFERDHFGANVDPRGFVDCLSPPLREELAEAQAEEPDEADLGWLARALEQAQAASGWAAIDRQIVAALDEGNRDALHVLADALVLAGDARGELLALELAGKRSHARTLALLDPLERRLATLEQAELPQHLRIDDWWPRVWTQWCGPFLLRLVVRHAMAWPNQNVPAFVDWHHGTARKHIATLLRLPCARYLSTRRITVLSAALQLDMRGHDLAGLELARLDLRGAKLGGASLTGCKLAESKLAHADLCSADLRDADLRNADLRSAALRDADLRGADLHDTDLRFADLRGTRLDGGALLVARHEGVRR